LSVQLWLKYFHFHAVLLFGKLQKWFLCRSCDRFFCLGTFICGCNVTGSKLWLTIWSEFVWIMNSPTGTDSGDSLTEMSWLCFSQFSGIVTKKDRSSSYSLFNGSNRVGIMAATNWEVEDVGGTSGPPPVFLLSLLSFATLNYWKLWYDRKKNSCT